jgi:hypothetical protein
LLWSILRQRERTVRTTIAANNVTAGRKSTRMAVSSTAD